MAFPRCGAKLRKKDRRCNNMAGFRTPHHGEGRCYLHGGLTPIKHGRYSKIKHHRVRRLLDELAKQDRNVMDLEPEAQLLRAMIIDFVNRYDTFVSQLDAWYDAVNRDRTSRTPTPLPPLPKRIPELGDIQGLAEGVSRIIERMHRIQKEGSLTLDTFRAATQAMGLAVARFVTDPKVLSKIEHAWADVMIDPRSFTTGQFDELHRNAEGGHPHDVVDGDSPSDSD